MSPDAPAMPLTDANDAIPDDVPEEMDFEYATAMADRARELMVRHSVAPTADNFSVWFQYALGTDPELNQTIDIIISNKKTFDKRINWGLVQALKKLHGRDETVSSIVTDRLQNVLGKATSYLAKAASDHQEHVQRLGGVASQIESGFDPMLIIGDLTSELSRAALRATALEMQFVSTSKELDQVRGSLKVAEKSSRTDVLTGLANRRAFEEFLRVAQLRAMEHGELLSMMLIDLDHFKQFNDTFGHQLGDHVLRLIGGVLAKGVRQNDFVGRYGGEELVAVLPGTDLAVCMATAERIRTAIAQRQIVRRATGEVLAKVTVSIGIAQFVPGETVAKLFERCDRALYLAKHNGRNCTACAEQFADEIAVECIDAA
jgi:diguanylate cyclase